MQYHENNKYLIQQNLEKIVAIICVSCRLGIADWDFNESLRLAIKSATKQTDIKDQIDKYNETFELAKKNNIQLDGKFKELYQLNN